MDEEPGRDFSYKRRPASTKLAFAFSLRFGGRTSLPHLNFGGTEDPGNGRFWVIDFLFQTVATMEAAFMDSGTTVDKVSKRS
jgi:hypothetical protein